MLKLIYSMAELDTEQLLAVYDEHRWNEIEFIDYLREDFFRQRDAFYAVWIVDGLYEAAVRLEPYKDGLLLHSLETAPNSRRKGYGISLVSDLLQFLRNSQFNFVYAHVHKGNTASLNLHYKCGFQILSDSARYIDGTVTQNSYTLSIEIKK